jgi:hypothetical protein
MLATFYSDHRFLIFGQTLIDSNLFIKVVIKDLLNLILTYFDSIWLNKVIDELFKLMIYTLRCIGENTLLLNQKPWF